VDVRVHREEEAGRREAAGPPEAEVVVARADRPAEEEVRALAGAPVAGRGEEEAKAARVAGKGEARPLPEHSEEAVEGGDEVRPPVVAGGEEGSERPFGAESGADGPEERSKGSGVDPPVDESVEAAEAVRPALQDFGGAWAERREEPLERGADRGDPSEGERGGEEGDRFAIRGVGITVRKEKGIRVETSSAPLFLEGGEARPQGVEVGTSEPPSHLAGSIRVRGSLSDPPGGIAW